MIRRAAVALVRWAAMASTLNLVFWLVLLNKLGEQLPDEAKENDSWRS